jgi:hypothetical protein
MKRTLYFTITAILVSAGFFSTYSQNPGDLIITEYMANSQDVPNDQGEYIEVYNPVTYPVSLYGCVLQDASGLSVTIDQSIWLNPGEFAVLGRPAVPGAAFYFPTSPPPFNLNNMGGDQILLTCNGVLVAHTSYTSNQQAGQAVSLAGTHLHNNGHTLEAHYGPESYQFQYPGTGTTDYGSPGFAGSTFILPVSMSHFTVLATEAWVDIHWETVSEFNNSHFILERSTNGRDFSPVAEIDGAGESGQPLQYHYRDEHPLAGESYYRLIQFDYDGTHTYSEVRSVHFTPEAIKVYPTLVEQEITMEIPEAIRAERELMIVSQDGRVVASKKLESGTSRQTIDLSHIPRGIYCIAAGSIRSARFVKR